MAAPSTLAERHESRTFSNAEPAEIRRQLQRKTRIRLHARSDDVVANFEQFLEVSLNRTSLTCYFLFMKNPIPYSLLLLCLLMPTIVSAQETRKHPIDEALDICTDKDPSTGGMVRCTDIAYKKWDQELNKNYQTLMRKLKPVGKRLLKSAQLSWITYRDNEFKLIDSIYDNIQGTMYISMRIDEKMQIVKQRAIALANHVDMFDETEL